MQMSSSRAGVLLQQGTHMANFQRLRAVMLDWAGTTVDHGSIAPVIALQSLFQQRGMSVSVEEARRDMGLLKRDHIRAILSLHAVQQQWHTITGRVSTEADVESLFDVFGPLQMQVITQHSQVIDGVTEVVQDWQRRGLRIGTTTGYTRTMLDPVMRLAAESGYRPDASVCPDEVNAGRPAPWMLMRNAQLLDVYPPAACVKIGDTIVDIEEGRNAGMWTIGLTRTGNMIGLDASDWAALDAAEKHDRLTLAANSMLTAGAHFVAESLAACDPLLALIEERLAKEPQPLLP
jgi:phosphonoacetaldehyde hydrolase